MRLSLERNKSMGGGGSRVEGGGQFVRVEERIEFAGVRAWGSGSSECVQVCTNYDLSEAPLFGERRRESIAIHHSKKIQLSYRGKRVMFLCHQVVVSSKA
eukprot:TRINITY_DN19429_c0_g1_i4.p2 TRINITY_DN19429_c0_g1~~TRINITY_DN19429_c0_g1_i4.p2  ORF type:complete len:100 (-),score=13.85 TRINITY_DN19429_c0_g1_i4:577-876(-)